MDYLKTKPGNWFDSILICKNQYFCHRQWWWWWWWRLYKMYFRCQIDLAAELSFRFCVFVSIVAWMCLYLIQGCVSAVWDRRSLPIVLLLFFSPVLDSGHNFSYHKRAINTKTNQPDFFLQILGVFWRVECKRFEFLKQIWKSSAEEAEKIDQVLDIPAASFSVIWLLMGASEQRNLVRDLENVGGRNQQSEMKQRVGQSCQNAWGRSCALGCFCSQVTS